MQKVLIANRGEIAVRIIRACHDLGLQTVAVYSQADAEALHVLHADEAICIGEAPSHKSYLKIPNILSACEITGADAIHPGYGFLSENANFASICESCGLNFIGPSPTSIALLGDKAKAKMTAKKAKCPVIPGSEGIVTDLKHALEEAKKIGYPVFIKAVAGGGGKGIRIAQNEDEFAKMFVAARTEAEVSFGNPDVYLEKMIMNPRHIEVQIIGEVFEGHGFGGFRTKGQTGFYVTTTDELQSFFNFFRSFEVEGNHISPGFYKSFNEVIGIVNHQMNIQKHICRAIYCCNGLRSHGNILHKITVHNVEMQPIGAGVFNAFSFIG